MRALLGRRFGRDAPRRQSETCATANHSLPSRALKATLLASAVFLSLVTAARAEIFYVYDDLSRLVAVVDEQGNAATYTYDAVGNILKIDRFDAAQQPGPVRITLVTPTAGKVGTQVQIFGTDRKSTRLNSSHSQISYAVFCLKKKKKRVQADIQNTDTEAP